MDERDMEGKNRKRKEGGIGKNVTFCNCYFLCL
jgi:hypothetical protein